MYGLLVVNANLVKNNEIPTICVLKNSKECWQRGVKLYGRLLFMPGLHRSVV